MTKYSKQPFDGYTHRFKVKFCVENDWRNDAPMDIYSDCESSVELRNFINEKKSKKVTSFNVFHTATKEQDEINAKFIEETLKDL